MEPARWDRIGKRALVRCGPACRDVAACATLEATFGPTGAGRRRTAGAMATTSGHESAGTAGAWIDAAALRVAGRRYDGPNHRTIPGATLVTNLPERLRLETRDLHARSERSGVMAELLAQRLDRDGYTALLRNLHALYAALEAALRRRQGEPLIRALTVAPLAREAALAGDLDVLHGLDWRAQLDLAPATARYVCRLTDLGDGASPALVAHAYVRYLGDLHGGQVLKRLVGRSLGLSTDVGLGFYDFGTDARVVELRGAFRAGLAQIRVGQTEADQIVTEARWAFEQHVLLFEQLAERPLASV